MTYESLFSPITIGNLTLKNRIVLPAMGTKFPKDNEVTKQLIDYHIARAKGGSGLNIVEICCVHQPSAPSQYLSIAEDRFIPGLKSLADAIHEAGGKAALQLWQGSIAVAGKAEVLVASDMPVSSELTFKGMTKDEIAELINLYGAAAKRAVEANYDCVEIHMGHNYILHSFLSAAINKREDEFGGSFENRAKFPLEVIRSVKKNVPSDFPIFMRIDAHDDYLEGGLTIEEVIDFCKLAKEAGIDVVDVSRGNIISAGLKYEVPPVDIEHGFNIANAARIKQETGLITMGVGRVNYPELANKYIENGSIDLIGIGRAQLADPEFANKAMNDKTNDIVRCVGCNQGCYDACERDDIPHITCLRNPMLGRESLYELTQTTSPKKVLVAGGGIGGLEAAMTLKLRGHNVELYEKSSQLGGQFLTAGEAPRKIEMKEAVLHKAQQTKESGVPIHLNIEVTPDLIIEKNPEVIINAIGATSLKLPLPGLDSDIVFDAHDVLNGDAKPSNEKLVVIGGGLVGLEVAEYMFAHGTKDVTIIEMREEMGADLGSTRKIVVMEHLYANGATLINNAKCLGIENNEVIIEVDGKEQRISANVVIEAVGARSNNFDSVEAYAKEHNIDYYVIGDALKPRRAIDATAEAAKVAREI